MNDLRKAAESVDAVNISAERVDETGKGEHEPVAWFIQYEDSHEFVWSKPSGWRVTQALEIQQLYTAPPKREWVGLTEDEKQFFKAMGFSGIDVVEAKLKEKNYG